LPYGQTAMELMAFVGPSIDRAPVLAVTASSRVGHPRKASPSRSLSSLRWQSFCGSRIQAVTLSAACSGLLVWKKAHRRTSAKLTARCAPVAANVQSWDELQVEVGMKEAGKRLFDVDAKITKGILPHTNAKVRYFDEEQSKPRVTLYRDSAAWCPYCQKVWLLLEEKQINFEVYKVNMRSYGDKPPEFLSKVPRGLLPAVEIDGRLMTESLDIMFTLERMFQDPNRPMFPVENSVRERAIRLLELERAAFGAWCGFLFRPELPFIGNNTSEFQSALQQIDDELASNLESDWFLPYQHPTIVDMQYVSHVERMVASALYYKGFDIREEYPGIDNWLAAFEALPYYMASKSDFYTHCMDIPPQYGPPFPSQDEQARYIRAAIDPSGARAPVAWKNDPEPWTEGQEQLPEEEYRIEAAWSLIKNHTDVARFCCRAVGQGVGSWGRGNPTRCGLADPYAESNETAVDAVDSILGDVAAALIKGRPGLASANVRSIANAASLPPQSAAECLAYLQRRIGVPRDMSMPAAKLLRAYLGEAIQALSA